ncbi:hypothetical protein C8Q80DRAFT_1320268 [Daedaleopsis nitida]|nr:hypothetical protein C8Q80DRAFT_1320268 [Daedaleopsis nitida]
MTTPNRTSEQSHVHTMPSDDEVAEIVASYASVKTGTFLRYAAPGAFKRFDQCMVLQWTSAVSENSLYLPFAGESIDSSVIRLLQSLTPSVLMLAVFSGARAYALCSSWLVSGLVTLLSLAPFCVNWVDWALLETPVLHPTFGCGVDTFETQRDDIIAILALQMQVPLRAFRHIRGDLTKHWIVVICSRIPLILADILLVIITLRKLGGEHSEIKSFFGKRGFSTILLGNGILYFGILSVLNTLHLIFSATSIFTEGFGSELTRFTDPLTTILVYRFILDLQEANDHNVKIGLDDPELQGSMSSQSSLSFVDRAIGSLGSTIVSGDAAISDDAGVITRSRLRPHLTQRPSWGKVYHRQQCLGWWHDSILVASVVEAAADDEIVSAASVLAEPELSPDGTATAVGQRSLTNAAYHACLRVGVVGVVMYMHELLRGLRTPHIIYLYKVYLADQMRNVDIMTDED